MKARIPALVFMGLVALLYVAARACMVSFTWDEGWTFTHHVLPGVLYPSEHDLMSGNHHLLNVWSMWLCAKLFGESEPSLRLPNVLALVLFLYAAARIALRAHRTLWVVVGFVLLVGQHFVLEFFGLARGYGLAFGFMLMSLWHMVQWCDQPDDRRLVVFMLLYAALATLAHFVMLNFFVAVAVVLAWRAVSDHRRTGGVFRRSVVWPIIISIVLATVVAPQVLGIVRNGGLIWGCDAFWSCTVRGLVERLVGMDVDTALIGPLIVLAIGFLAEAALVRWDGPHRSAATIAAVLLLCAGLIGAEHAFFGMELPRTRTALYLVPLSATVVVLWLQANTVHWPWLWWPALLVACGVVASTVRQANLTHTAEWPQASEVDHMLELVQADRAARPIAQRTRLSTGPVSWGSLGYYFHRLRITDIDTVRCWPSERHRPSDHYIVEPHGQPFDTSGTELLFRSATDVRLYRRSTDQPGPFPFRILSAAHADHQAQHPRSCLQRGKHHPPHPR